MKFIIDRELLLITLQSVSKGLSQKTPMPVLTGIQITIQNGKISCVCVYSCDGNVNGSI